MKTQHILKIKERLFNLFFSLFFILLFLSGGCLNAQNKDFIVVLDAGHGGKDPGKVGIHKIKEKDVALNIVLQVGKMLEKQPGIRVVYTRKTDVFVNLWERGRIANKADADLFVSIHCNAHHTQAYGSETYALGTHVNKQNFEVAKAENSVILLEDNYEVNYKGFDPNSPESVIGLNILQEEYLDQSITLARIIQDEFTYKLKRKDRGVKQAGFVVLHQTYMPSVLIETGFLTNKNEGPYLNSKEGKSKFSKSIFDGIMKYKDNLYTNTVTQSESIVSNEPSTSNNDDGVYEGVTFKVQIASGSRKLATKSYNFNGLKNVERVKVGRSYKYYIGKTSNYTSIQEDLRLAKTKGYTTSFIVAFKNGEKVSIDEILQKS